MAGIRIAAAWRGAEAVASVEEAAGRGLSGAAELLLEASRAQVPRDSGALAASGEVSVSGLSASVSYGTPYACRWHEEQARFRGGKNKYLEDPCNDKAVHAGMEGRIGDAVRL